MHDYSRAAPEFAQTYFLSWAVTYAQSMNGIGQKLSALTLCTEDSALAGGNGRAASVEIRGGEAGQSDQSPLAFTPAPILPNDSQWPTSSSTRSGMRGDLLSTRQRVVPTYSSSR